MNTSKGQSGSPVFEIPTWNIIGVHSLNGYAVPVTQDLFAIIKEKLIKKYGE